MTHAALPTPPKDKSMNTSTEAIWATEKNFKIVEKYLASAKPINGIILTGSNAWGAFQAVTKNSDIDLLVVADTLDQLEKLIAGWKTAKLISPVTGERFNLYRDLYKGKKANHFSIIEHNADTAISIDFLLTDIIKDIASLKPIGTKTHQDEQGAITIRTLNEFRCNIPKSSGYTLDDLKGLRKSIYYPKFKEVKNAQGDLMGYLAETLIDGQANANNDPDYFLGVMSFFLAIHPIVLIDTKQQCAVAIKTLQTNISKIIQGQIPAYITRQERMSPDSLKKNKGPFSK